MTHPDPNVEAPAAQPVGASARVRPAEPEDAGEILRLIHELAAYERAADAVVATEADISAVLWASDPTDGRGTRCHVIDADAPGRLAGFALWFRNTSTWLGRHGLYLEDLFVSPDYRGRGYGEALMASLAAVCVEQGWARFEWSVLDWNTPAIDFYRALGATAMDEWTVYRLTGEALESLASRAPG